MDGEVGDRRILARRQTVKTELCPDARSGCFGANRYGKNCGGHRRTEKGGLQPHGFHPLKKAIATTLWIKCQGMAVCNPILRRVDGLCQNGGVLRRWNLL